jgi:hypothetical protein
MQSEKALHPSKPSGLARKSNVFSAHSAEDVNYRHLFAGGYDCERSEAVVGRGHTERDQVISAITCGGKNGSSMR